MDDLKARLLAVESGRPDSLGIATSWYRNPEGPAALNRIAELEAENASLKAQLAMVEAETLERAAKIADSEAEATEDTDNESGDYWIASHIARAIRDLKNKDTDHDAG